MEFGREAVAEHLVKNNMPTSAKLKNAFKEFVDDDWIAKDLEKCHERIMELRDKTLLDEFARKMHLLLSENGVKVVGNIVDDMSFDEENNIYFGKSELVIEHLDFSEHDKPFEDRIAQLKKDYKSVSGLLSDYQQENESLKQRISEIENFSCQAEQESESMILELKQRIAELEGEKSENCEKEPISDDARPSSAWYENRYQQDCITINRLNTTIDVLIHKIEYLRQFAGLE